MKVLMFLRDALPPSRVDVRVLFDRALRDQGIATDYVGAHHAHGTVPAGAGACRGALLEAAPAGHRPRWWRAASIAWRCAPRYALVIVRDQPVVAALVFALARLRGAKTAYWMSFPIPLGDRMGAVSHWRNRRPVRAALVWLRGAAAEILQRALTLPLAQRVFVQSDAMREQVCAWGARPDAVIAVPMGIDATLLRDLAPAGLPAPDAPRRVVYLGALGRSRRLDVVVDALAIVLTHFPAARLMLIGGADDPDDLRWLEKHAAQRGVGHAIDLHAPCAMRDAWALARTAEVAIAPIPPGPLHDVSSPTKTVEYLALGLPVVASRIPDQEAIMQACGGGHCVDFAADDIARALCEVMSHPEEARAAADGARRKVLQIRSYDVLAAGVADSLHALVHPLEQS